MANYSARILVVDDAPLIRQFLEQVLLKFGYRVKTAENGQEAIDYFIDYQPDLILMDADMPVLDGITACAHIRELPEAQHLPIIMVTAFVERKWVDRAYAAGATDYVTKPVNLDVLRNRIHYILQAKRAEEALFDEKEKAQVTLTAICDGVITTNAQGQVEFLNPVAPKLTGWTIEEAYGLHLNDMFSIIDEKTQQPVEYPIHRCLEQGEMVELTTNIVLVHRQKKKKFAIEDSAAPIRDRNGFIIGVVLVFHDVTQTRKMTQQLAFRAKHDALTGLYNLHEFKAQLKRLLDSLSKQKAEHALLYMDLDQFKTVNDSCGHEAGDQLLKDVAMILQKKLDKQSHHFTQAILARLGGDEFGLLLEECALKETLKIAEILCESIESFKFFWENDNKEKGIFTIGVSIGLVPISLKTRNQKSLLAMADAACYTAKNRGRNGVHVYQEDGEELLDKNIEWVSLINDNLDKEHGFSLFYQPIISLTEYAHSVQANRYEILLRMKDQQDYLVPPGAFLSAAMRYNLMPTLDLWVIKQVLKWLEDHPEQLEQFIFITINISGPSLSEGHVLKTVIQAIQNSDVSPSKLCFELPESSAISNITTVLDFVNPLRELGCHFILDNFGSGIAAFTYLKNLPVDFLKIDGTLTKGIIDDPTDYAMVKAINDIAHLMNIQTIAEFVENEATLSELKALQVDYVQGYWMGKPQPLD